MIIHARRDNVDHRRGMNPQPHQRLSTSSIAWPPQPAQSPDRVGRKRCPSLLHSTRKRGFRRRGRNATDGLGIPRDHVDLDAVVGPARRRVEQPQIRPVGHVARAERRHARGRPPVRLGRHGAREGFELEFPPRALRKRRPALR